ncbi:alpha/beta fold hydrolase [Aureibacillus halotolerans]|uniref:Pimeloyl-ACP methyl ester carboxylesterase n=1 Tax=Aureibacillus halotolerans TaxID=1508390 RepID=A0A4R6U8P9_9BACI|nr:alpha/beta hydrolase [Aureibacillus halotolerans]TDQ42960.1 pimeloyl-ACP methyl ester carboxylesterase [Aureibacillus halotolerans]
MAHSIRVEKDVSLFVEDIGEGQPIVFIHGWPVNHKMFEYQMNELPKKGYRCIGIDLRGFGKSDKPAFGYDYDTLAQDVKKVIDSLQLSNVFVAGFSMGGPIAIRYATKFAGDELKQLILMGAAAPSFTQRSGYDVGMKKEDVDELITSIQADRPQAIKDFGSAFFYSDVSDSLANWFLGLGLEASAYGTIAAAESLRDEDLREEVTKVSVPTLLMHGKKDEICDFAFSEKLHEAIPNSTLIPFENSGHGLIYDEKEACNQALLNLLR